MNSINQLLDDDADYSLNSSTISWLGVDTNCGAQLSYGQVTSGQPANSISSKIVTAESGQANCVIV